MRSMKGARAVAGWMLILIAVCIVPAVSAAQDTETATVPEPAEDSVVELGEEPADELGEQAADAEPAVEQQVQAEPAAQSAPPAPASRSGKARASASASVSIGDNFYSPASVSIAVGETVSA